MAPRAAPAWLGCGQADPHSMWVKVHQQKLLNDSLVSLRKTKDFVSCTSK